MAHQQIVPADEAWPARLTATGPERDVAVSELRQLFYSRLQRTLSHKSGVDDALLEDVAQEALIKTLSALDQFEGRSRFTTWATTIAVRVAYTELRKRRWRDVSLDQLVEDGALDAAERIASNARADDRLLQNSLVEHLYRIIDVQLTKKQRTAVLAELQGMPLEEIGRRMGSNRNAVYKLTHDARKRLRLGLESAGYSASDLSTT